jgi:hypothetical protein
VLAVVDKEEDPGVVADKGAEEGVRGAVERMLGFEDVVCKELVEAGRTPVGREGVRVRPPVTTVVDGAAVVEKEERRPRGASFWRRDIM